VPDIIKTWPAAVPAKTVARIFSADTRWSDFYFTLGRAKPKQEIDRLWFTYQGRILGSFKINRVVIQDGSLPKLHRLDGEESEWQIPPDRWVAICGDFVKLKERLFMSGFRGFRYFDFDQYRSAVDSRIRL
jgi:hypothetical protein